MTCLYERQDAGSNPASATHSILIECFVIIYLTFSQWRGYYLNPFHVGIDCLRFPLLYLLLYTNKTEVVSCFLSLCYQFLIVFCYKKTILYKIIFIDFL